MNTIVVDAGPLFAAFSRKDRHYPAALRFIRMTGVRLLTNIPVITEVAHMLGKAPTTRLEFLKWSDGALDIDEATAGDLPRIVAILEK